ncbi:methylisocitrate lyase [Carboxydochorda subterranea]|uniref:Methylisocitrate lyase n=1 Tax=Carboxydichorda subterranea TaxID=3109565 RepID=A0ABZ1BXW1_9FIRM|nr:methylisocitrate lyase [Limnochorda sp. L945t]WRP17345.1 methylisocitrate lyase [Limnochorda sp. L945t]
MAGPAWVLERPGTEHPGTVLRRLLEGEPIVVAPGAFNPLVGLIARKVGFRALYFSGAAFSASMGLPDLGLFTLTELSQAVRQLFRATGLPIVVDADTGFGEALNVAAAVRELEEAGAAAIQIEDQEMPKKCGHLSGKSVVAAEEMVAKVAAAARVRREALIVARTDARATHGLSEAVRRARLYLEAGADVIFPEALESEEEFRTFARQVPAPLLANMTEWGKTPYLSVEQFRAMGYKMVVFPVSTLRVAARAVEEVLVAIRERGTQADLLDRMQTRRELYDLIGYEEYERFDRGLAEEGRHRAGS